MVREIEKAKCYAHICIACMLHYIPRIKTLIIHSLCLQLPKHSLCLQLPKHSLCLQLPKHSLCLQLPKHSLCLQLPKH